MPNFTKNAIKASFMKLLNEMPLNRISVRCIVEDCGINRNSFYYHYQDIPSLIEEIVKEDIDRLIAEYPTIDTMGECVRVAFKFALENRRAVFHIFNSVNRDIYEKYMMKLCEYVVETYIDTAFEHDTVSEYDRRLIVRFFKCEVFGLFLDWVSGGMRDDAIDEVYHMIDVCSGLSGEIIRRLREKENAT